MMPSEIRERCNADRERRQAIIKYVKERTSVGVQVVVREGQGIVVIKGIILIVGR